MSELDEMTQDMCKNVRHNGKCATCYWRPICGVRDCCKNLISKGYRKINKDEIVISKAEYQRLLEYEQRQIFWE